MADIIQRTTAAIDESLEYEDKDLPNTTVNYKWQDFSCVWLDRTIDPERDENSRLTMEKLKTEIEEIHTFTDLDECINFIVDHEEEQIHLIISGGLGKWIVPIIHDMPQITAIYVFCVDILLHSQWATCWSKIKAIISDITALHKTIKQVVEGFHQNTLSISLIMPNYKNSGSCYNSNETAFVFSRLLKQIILCTYIDRNHSEFVAHCHKILWQDSRALRDIEIIGNDYYNYKPIWWYTNVCCLQWILDRSLQLMQIDNLIYMGFFIRDLLHNIAELHTKHFDDIPNDTLTIYRAHRLSKADFDQIKNSNDGILSFNNFLRATTQYEAALINLRKLIENSELIGVLFIMKVDLYIRSTRLASIRDFAPDKKHDVLVTMNSVFCIESIQQMDKNDRLWQVHLKLISDGDPKLDIFTKYFYDETYELNRWIQLGKFLIQCGEPEKTEHLYKLRIAKTESIEEQESALYQLGLIKFQQKKYSEALVFFEIALHLAQKIVLTEYPYVSMCYSAMGAVYYKTCMYDDAFSFFQKALQIRRKHLAKTHLELAHSYKDIGLVYSELDSYADALSKFRQALEIYEKCPPTNHLNLACCYYSIGLALDNTNEYSSAFSYFQKAAQILEKTSLENYLYLAEVYNSIGFVLRKMREYARSFSAHQIALNIFQEILPPNHSYIAETYTSLGLACEKMCAYWRALTYFMTSLNIYQNSLPSNDDRLVAVFTNIGTIYERMGDYTAAVQYYDKALEIMTITSHSNHELIQSYAQMIQCIKEKSSSILVL